MVRDINHSQSWRSVAAGITGTLGVLLILTGGLLTLGNRAVFNSDFFSDHVASSLKDPRVASYLAGQITDAVVEKNEDLILVRPLIEGTAQVVVSSQPFRAIFRTAVKQSHQLMVSEGGHDILLSLSDVGVILKNALASQPTLAEKIPDNLVVVTGRLETGVVVTLSREIFNQGQQFGPRPRWIFWLGMVLLFAGVILSANNELALFRAGVALILTTVVIIFSLELGVFVIEGLPEDPALGAALAGIWVSFVGGFYKPLLILGGIGLILTAAATAFLEVFQIGVLQRQLHRLLLAPTEHRGLRLLRAAVLVCFGGMALVNPTVATKLVVILGGGVVAFIGLRDLCRLAVDPVSRQARQEEEQKRDGDQQTRTWRRSLVAFAVIGLVGLGIVLISWIPDQRPEALITEGCNGSRDLCDRPLDQVVFACAHNAMGAADVPGWMFPNHQRGIESQLQDGIRAFMLDVLPGISVGDAVKTDIDDSQIVREKLEPALGAEGLDAALRIRERLLDVDSADSELFLCHGLCELGAAPLVPVLATMHDFLILNPNEVIIIIIEDAVPAADIAAAFEDSRLLDLVYRGPVTPPWPTLGEMVATNQRVLVLAENDSEGVDWYHPAFTVFQETPYHFSHPDSFSCRPNRGGTDGSLLMINHWVTTPPTSLPSDAALVNTREALLERVAQCERERGKRPNIIAVDFYRTGDLVEVVRELNEKSIDQK